MKKQSFHRRLGFALEGMKQAFVSEPSFRFQVLAAVAAVSLLIALDAAFFWWGIFLLIIGTILAAELMNTALETLVDHLHPDVHPSIKKAKDAAAASVLLLSFVSIVVFLIFLADRFLNF